MNKNGLYTLVEKSLALNRFRIRYDSFRFWAQWGMYWFSFFLSFFSVINFSVIEMLQIFLKFCSFWKWWSKNEYGSIQKWSEYNFYTSLTRLKLPHKRNRNRFWQILNNLQHFKIFEFVNFSSYYFTKPLIFSLEPRNLNKTQKTYYLTIHW